MFNSAINKTSNNNILERSALFDFSKQGFSPLLIKSKLSFYDQEIKEGNLYNNEHFDNKDFLRDSLFKEKFQLNTLNKKNSPFNLNFIERRNSLTKQGIPQTKKLMSNHKIFGCFNQNLNLATNNFDKNYLFDSNLGKNNNSNYLTTNALTGSNSNLFKTFNNKLKEKAKEIKYADDYSFKKNNFYSEIVDLIEDNVEDDTEQQKNEEIENFHPENINLRRSSRLNRIGYQLKSLLKPKKSNSIAIENKKFKKLNKTKIKNKKKNNNNNSDSNQNNNVISNAKKEQKEGFDLLLQKAANSNSKTIANEETIKEDKEIKGFSFLKQKRKAPISSSLFGCSSSSNPKNIEKKVSEKENVNIKSKLTWKSINKVLEEDTLSYNSIPSSEESESEFVWSRDISKTKLQREPNPIVKADLQLYKKTKETIENKKFKVESDVKTKKIEKLSVKNSKTNNIRNSEKKICFSVSKSVKKPEISDYTSSAFSFGFENKNKQEQNEKQFEDEKNFCDIMEFKDSIGNFPVKNNTISMENLNEIFGQKTFRLRKNKTTKMETLKNLISYVNSKNVSVNLPQNNKINHSSEAFNKSDSPSSKIKANRNENIISGINFSSDNINKNFENLYDSFEDDETMKKFSSYRNNKVKDLMIEYIVWGKPINKKLGFGDCPLNVYADFFMRGKEEHSNYLSKLEDKAYLSKNFKGKNPKRNFMKHTLANLNEIALTMKEISCKLSQYPIFNYGLDFDNKHKNKEKQREKTEITQFTRPKKISRTNITEKVLAKINNTKNKTSSKDNNDSNNFQTVSKKPTLIIKANNNTAKKTRKHHIKDEEYSSYMEDSDDLNSEVYSNSKKKPEKESNFITEGYNCELCGQIFSNGQGLGGHMSRKHPNQSEKYKNKKETRERRNPKREILYKAQKVLLSHYRQDYEKLKQTCEGRKLIKKICKDHKTQYYQIKKEIKISRNSHLRRKSKN